jgi:CDP-2,3-bis-(O-geranylgeranyl)-sn-glycerol synthase
MQAMLIGRLVVLLAMANGAPVLAKKLMGNLFAVPLDGGVAFMDGRPLFGTSKTIRGIVLSVATTSLAAPLAGLDWKLGALTATGAMAGDLFSSFVKRRLDLPPSSMAIGLDQIPESLIPLILCRLQLPVTALDIAVGVTLFFIGELILSRLLFMAHVREQPF